MSVPLIGITTSSGKTPSGFPASIVQTAYVNAVIRAGGVPVLIPNQLDESAWRILYVHLGGVLFTGGGDIRTEVFNGTPHPEVDGVDDERDALELSLLRSVVSDRRPFLGICRGLQVANVALGGSLYTHIPDQHKGAARHDWSQGYPRTHLAHPVRVEEGSHLATILGEPVLEVNSLHHQAIKELAPDLKAVAFSPDGIVEAVELPEHPYGIAVQWHPEWLPEHQAMRNLLKSFVDAARVDGHGS